ncbi:DUF4158 domain-containing protein [Streptomyces xanthophaeus]
MRVRRSETCPNASRNPVQEWISKSRSGRFALQMWTVRYVGLFLEGLLAVPWPVVERLAVQLGIGDPSVVKRYTERCQALYVHVWEIRDAASVLSLCEDGPWGAAVPFLPAQAGVDARRGAEGAV